MRKFSRLLSRALLALPVVLLSACDTDRARTAAPASVVDDQPVLTLLGNARIHTVDPQLPAASALLFSAGGEIVAVGETAALRAAWPDARFMDLQGRVVVPGLIDSHGHLYGLAQSLTRAQLAGTRDLSEIISRLRDFEQTLADGDWLIGRGWDQNDWPVQAFPSRRDLDEHFPDRPVWLERIDGHAGWANSMALAQLDQDLGGDWQPEGGYIHRDALGQPTGILIDQAMRPLDVLVPPISAARMRQALEDAIGQMLSFGLTGVHDPGISLEVLDFYQGMIADGDFNTRVYAMANGYGPTLEWLCANGPVAHPSGRLYMRATKLYGDGALGSRGAALLADYHDEPGNRGLLFLDAERMQAHIERVLECGLQAGVHAIGDRANRVVLDALEAAIAAHPGNPGRHRIEHAQVLAAADLRRFAQLDIIAAMQPTHATSDMYWAVDRLGPERLRFSYAWRSLLDSGARVAFGSDFPVEAVNPMLGIHAAVSRQDLEGWPEGGWQPQERVLREEALRGFTLDAAWAGFMEQQVGSLEAGKRADFVVLDADPLTVPVAEIPRIRVLQTWLDGQLVFERAQP